MTLLVSFNEQMLLAFFLRKQVGGTATTCTIDLKFIMQELLYLILGINGIFAWLTLGI